MGSVWVVVVARVGNGAKSRLGGALEPEQRRHLALAMLTDVLAACEHARERGSVTGTIGVLDEVAARGLGDTFGITVVDDHHTGDMNIAVLTGVAAAHARGADTVIVLPGDVPLISAADLEALLRATGTASRAVIVGASHDGEGTNALLLRPPDVIAPAFGPPSLERHLASGRAAGARSRAVANLGLALDVDTPIDLDRLRASHPGGHTAEALGALVPV
jgi:2-phospho-L-lactate/phosphoenolpyruvate guanylyltransferase